MRVVLEINNLTKTYGRLKAVDSLSLKVEKGSVYGLLGPNGSGKSTTLGVILGIVNPDSGNWKWFGNESNEVIKHKVGAIIESPKFYPYLTAYENLKVVASIKEVPYSKIDEKLSLVGLIDRKNNKFKEFSLGMKQRLAIAGALLNDPEILILDEPTNGLDPQGIHQIRLLIQKIAKEGTTIILASHLLDEVEKVCSHVIVLNKGKTLYKGSVNSMSSDNGYIELGTDSGVELLMKVLKESNFYASGEIYQDKIRLITNKDISPAEINSYLYGKGIVLNHLYKNKISLEEHFINLTNRANV